MRFGFFILVLLASSPALSEDGGAGPFFGAVIVVVVGISAFVASVVSVISAVIPSKGTTLPERLKKRIPALVVIGVILITTGYFCYKDYADRVASGQHMQMLEKKATKAKKTE